MNSIFVSVLVFTCCLASCVVATPNGLGMTPPMGWNTWCTSANCYQNNTDNDIIHDICNETEVMSIAQAMMDNGMRDAGYNYVNLDDCWANDERMANGSITWDKHRFPSGIPSLIDWLHSKGFLFGLYTSAGTGTCSSGGRPHYIPGSYGHYAEDAQTFADWNVDYVKLDWCNTTLANGTALDYETQTNEFAVAMNATGKPMWLNFHCGQSPTAAPVPEWCQNDGNSYRVTADHHDWWNSTRGNIYAMRYLGPYALPGHWNDPDFLMTGGAGCDSFTPGERCPGQTWEEYRTEFAIWSVTNSPLIVSSDVRNMNLNMTEILLNGEIIAVNQDTTYSGGSYAFNDTQTGVEFWVKKLGDGDIAVAIFNPTESVQTTLLLFSSLGLGNNTSCDVRDLWSHETYTGMGIGWTQANLMPHDTSLIRVSPAMNTTRNIA